MTEKVDACNIIGMYIATIPNRNSPPAILLREGYREGGKVKNRTLANLSKLPPEAIEAVRRILKGEKLVSTEELFEIVRTAQKPTATSRPSPSP